MRNGLTIDVTAHKCVICGVTQFISLLMLDYYDSQASSYDGELNQSCKWKTSESLDETYFVKLG